MQVRGGRVEELSDPSGGKKRIGWRLLLRENEPDNDFYVKVRVLFRGLHFIFPLREKLERIERRHAVYVKLF